MQRPTVPAAFGSKPCTWRRKAGGTWALKLRPLPTADCACLDLAQAHCAANASDPTLQPLPRSSRRAPRLTWLALRRALARLWEAGGAGLGLVELFGPPRARRPAASPRRPRATPGRTAPSTPAVLGSASWSSSPPRARRPGRLAPKRRAEALSQASSARHPRPFLARMRLAHLRLISAGLRSSLPVGPQLILAQVRPQPGRRHAGALGRRG